MKTTIKTTRSWLIAPALLLLAGCSSDSNYDFEASQAAADAQAIENSPPQALLDPTAGVTPFPNNLLFNDGVDGTINIPNPSSGPQIALNQQNGFSTVAPISAPVSEALNPDTLELGQTVRIFEVVTAYDVSPAEPPATTPSASLRSAVVANLGEIVDASKMTVTQAGNQLVLLPLEPLKPSTNYMVVLTNGIMGIDGNPLQPSFLYNLAKGTEPLTNPDLPAAAGLQSLVGTHINLLTTELGVNAADVVLSWVFSTQSIREPLQAVEDISGARPLVLGAATAGGANLTTASVNSALQGKADVYVGSLNLPYYLQVPEDINDRTILNSFWKNAAARPTGAFGADDTTPDYTPVQTQMVKVPVLMTLPNNTSALGGSIPDGGWPVTIFQHGVNRNRTDMLAVADALADAGRAVIAIDLPLHGVVDSTSPLHASNNPLQPVERTFDLDLLTIDADSEETLSQEADEVTDLSGRHFINLADLANARDNFRQSVADVFVLNASLLNAQIDSGAQLNTSNVSFVGHSLGGIVGATVLSYEDSFTSATLAMPGGGIAQLLGNSPRFSPIIDAQLAAQGIEKNSAQYQSFFAAAQTLLDSADPVNHASTIAAESTTPIHLIQVMNDQVIPNAVATAPLSGTEPLIRLLQLPPVTQSTTGGNAAVRFNQGHHGSILGPLPVPEGSTETPDLAPTIEMQGQIATFAGSSGAALTITNVELVQPVTPEE